MSWSGPDGVLQFLEEAADFCNRRPRTCLALLALLLAVQVSPYWYPTPDGTGYLSIARRLANGQAPANLGNVQLYLAPGYPLIVSPAFWAAERPFLVLSLIHCALMVAFLLGVYVWSRRLAPAGALFITALAVVNVEVWCLYRRTLSESAFMAVLVWTANAMQAAVQARPVGRTVGYTALAAVGLAGLVTIRQAGIVLAAGFGLLVLLECWRGKVTWLRSGLTLLAVGLPACLAAGGIALHDRAMAARSRAPTYLDRIIDPDTTWAGQLAEGLRLRVNEIGRVTVPGMFKSYGRRGEWLNVNMAVYVPLFLLIWLAWWRLVRRRLDVFALTFPFYLGLYVIWPFDQATRFTVPLAPFLMLCVWRLLGPLGRYGPAVLGSMLVVHLGIAAGYWAAVDLPRAREDNARWPAVEQLAPVIRADFGPVAARGIVPNAVSMFQLALDRPVRDQVPGEPVETDVRWLITPCQARGGDDFVPHATAGDYTLWRRDPSLPGQPGLLGRHRASVAADLQSAVPAPRPVRPAD